MFQLPGGLQKQMTTTTGHAARAQRHKITQLRQHNSSHTMISVKLISLLIILYHAMAFVPTSQMFSRTSQRFFVVTDQRFASKSSNDELTVPHHRGLATSAAAAGLGAFFQVGSAAALAAEELDIVELPPPYVPALFGLVLIVGVGVLTSSLGDVYTEGKEVIAITFWKNVKCRSN